MAVQGDRVTEKATGRTGVVTAHGVNDENKVGYTLVIWDDSPNEKDEVHDSILTYEKFVLVRQGIEGKALYAAQDGTETTALKAAKFDSREIGQRFKNEKNHFRSHELRLLSECK